MEKQPLHQDSVFKRIVVASTGLGLACMLASLAAIRIGRDTGLEFVWHWSILVVVAAGVFWNARFWKAVWAEQQSSTADSRRKVKVHLAVLALLGIGSFLYPIRFIEQSYWSAIARGLFTAATFLATMCWLIYKAGQMFLQIDAAELKRQSEEAGESPAPL
jgi:hypothetical protein